MFNQKVNVAGGASVGTGSNLGVACGPDLQLLLKSIVKDGTKPNASWLLGGGFFRSRTPHGFLEVDFSGAGPEFNILTMYAA